MSSPIFLDNPEQEVVIDGKSFNVRELQNAIIDSHILRVELVEYFEEQRKEMMKKELMRDELRLPFRTTYTTGIRRNGIHR